MSIKLYAKQDFFSSLAINWNLNVYADDGCVWERDKLSDVVEE